jgi:2,3-bisphosphoglycerate-independent phosphoglycerate mutase
MIRRTSSAAGRCERGRMLFFFLDGVGIGRRDPLRNPFFSMPLPGFGALLGGPMVSIGRPSRRGTRSSVRPIDATLGVEGLPQSGTGQSSILTGENAPRLLGRHFGPFPHSGLRPLLAERNVFRRLEESGRSTKYINAFPRQYAEHAAKHPGRIGAFSFAWRSNGRPLNGPAELIAGAALSADCTSEGWARLGYPDVPVITPSQAASVALDVLSRHDFVLYEYYLTDHAGHGRSHKEASAILATLDEFVGSLARGLDPLRETLVVTSDHGNFEDLSSRQHTTNPVPFIAAGRAHERLTASVRDLTGIVPAILDYFSD